MNERQIKLLRSCKVAMKESLIKALNSKSGCNTRESLLAYFDHARFFGKDVKSDYSNPTQAINKVCNIEHTRLMKLHVGAG